MNTKYKETSGRLNDFLAWRKIEGHPNKPGVIFFSGFGSDMLGEKASALSQLCMENGLSYARFDYSGHGESKGNLEDFSITDWLNDSINIFDNVMHASRVILVGSSMGAWLAFLVALKRIDNIMGLIGVASALDFTQELVLKEMTEDKREELNTRGIVYLSSKYGSLPITKRLLEDGEKHLLLGSELNLDCHVHLIHGMNDESVPWEHSLRIIGRLPAKSSYITFIKDGDHRLSRLEDLRVISVSLLSMVKYCDTD